jgi:hypothetical protein
MHPYRFILAVLTALAWIVSSNSCLLAASLGPEADACCEHERGVPDSEGSQPCGGAECGKCATLDSGINVSVLVPLAAPAPQWMEDVVLSQLLRELLQLSVREVPFEPPNPDIPRSTWCDVVKKALPVRGPSLVS